MLLLKNGKMTEILSLLALLWLAGTAGAVAAEAPALTIYQQDLALIREVRTVELSRGINRLVLAGVSAHLQPESLRVRPLGAPGEVAVVGQVYDASVLTPQRLLESYLGRTVKVVRTNPSSGDETEVDAVVLAVDGGVVLQIGDRVETGVPGRIVFPELPQNLHARPVVQLELDSAVAGERDLEISYLSGGLSWHADYHAELSVGGESLSLESMASLDNFSGTGFAQARIKLVAGELHRAAPSPPQPMMRAMAAEAAPRPAGEQLFAYHLYSLKEPVTLRDRQSRQVAFLSAPEVSARTEYLLEGRDYLYRSRMEAPPSSQTVQARIRFDNEKSAGLGLPLPAGTVRFYQRDSEGGLQLVGEDRLPHTPEGEEVDLRLGNAFDLSAQRVQTDFSKLPVAPPHRSGFESAHRLVLSNAGQREVTVRVVEPLPGEWQVVEESLPHSRQSAGRAEWHVRVPAGGATVLAYRVQVRF